MSEQEICKSCSQKATCKEVYRALGSQKGPSVGFRSFFAFLVPIVVFIVALAVFEEFLPRWIESQLIRKLAGFIAALAVAAISVLVVRVINRKILEKSISRTKPDDTKQKRP
jgi:anaerobic C4-dicarboxylate transporter